MNYKDLEISKRYISKGNNNITDSFLNPVLKCTKIYKRSVGFFSSKVLETIMDGVVALSRNEGKINLIASPKLSEQDIQAIELGYANKEDKVIKVFLDDFQKELEKLNDVSLQFLAEIIAKGILDIKIAITDQNGIYHDKLGILEDFSGNKIVFYGSPNSSYSGYRANYEKIRVTKGWENNSYDIIEDEEREFDNLWNQKNEYVQVYSFSESAKKNILKQVEYRKNKKKSESAEPIQLRDYQIKAIDAWQNNNFHGFFVMATGTGKTWTAIYSAKRLIEFKEVLITICAPYKHLVKQWEEDVKKAFPKAIIILVSSDNPGWDKQIIDAILKKKYSNEDLQIIVISTILSFMMSRFDEAINKYHGEKLLIVDEAHRFTFKNLTNEKKYEYLLGLSATPYSGNSPLKGIELMNFFGGKVFSLTIEEALEREYLVPYYYYPIIVYATEDEENKFNYFSKIIFSCFKNGRCIDSDRLIKALRNRLRVISMAEAKQNQIDYIHDKISERNHVVVYCGDGKLFDNGQEIRHINSIKKALGRHSYKASQFTATESMQDRMELVDSFNKGEISALAAIRCLDEGINIPSISSALILSSNDDYREFVQRRGRILRKYKDKKFAKIYDVVVLPSVDSTQWAKIELRRFREYSRLAINSHELERELEKYLIQYGLSSEDVDVYDYEEMEKLEYE